MLGPDIALVSWNIEKGEERHWNRALADQELLDRLGRIDVLFLQEACIGGGGDLRDLGEPLRDRGFGWWAALSFASPWFGCSRGAIAGVATAARVMPLRVTGLRSRDREFGVTPKSALALQFDLADRPDDLLLINAHMLNFEVLSRHGYRRQLRGIVDLIAAHAGAVIFGGDLNTHNDYRLQLMQEVAGALCLQPAFHDGDGRSTDFLHHRFPLDQIFYRGLVLRAAHTGTEAQRDWSDHNSLSAEFSTEGEPDNSCRPDTDRAAALTAD